MQSKWVGRVYKTPSEKDKIQMLFECRNRYGFFNLFK